MASPPNNRIPSEDLDEYQSWEIPELRGGNKVLPSAEKEDRERRARQTRSKNEVVGEDVEDVRPLTAEQINAVAEAARQEGYSDGHQEGVAAGHTEGYDAGKLQAYEEFAAPLQDQINQLAAVIDELQNPYQQQSLQLEKIVLQTIAMLAKSVIKREVRTDSGDMRELVRSALAALPGGSDNISIYLNPADMSMLDGFLLERVGQWQVKADPSLLPGGCRIETKQSLVDYSVEERMRELCEKFVEGELVNELGVEDDDAFDEEEKVDDGSLLLVEENEASFLDNQQENNLDESSTFQSSDEVTEEDATLEENKNSEIEKAESKISENKPDLPESPL